MYNNNYKQSSPIFDKSLEDNSHNIVFSLPSDKINNQIHMEAFIGNIKIENKETYVGFSNSNCKFDSENYFSKNSVDCISRCLKWGCSNDECRNQCNNCGEKCYWKKTESMNENIPNITVKNISYDGKRAYIRWKFNNIDNDILGFVSVIYKTQKKNEGVSLNKIKLLNCNKYCTYIIDGLEPSVDYTVGVKSYNKDGVSRMSNLVKFKTIKANINTKNLSEVVVSDYDVGNFKRCEK